MILLILRIRAATVGKAARPGQLRLHEHPSRAVGRVVLPATTSGHLAYGTRDTGRLPGSDAVAADEPAGSGAA
jgi:hypothetical protein